MRARIPKGRSSDKVMEERLNDMLQVLAARTQVSRFELLRIFKPKWNCSWRTVDRILAQARKEMLARLGRTKEEFRCESMVFYERMASDPKASNYDKLSARRALDDLMGSWAPRVNLVGNAEGKAFEVKSTTSVKSLADEDLDKILAAGVAAGIPGLLASGRFKVNGNGGHEGNGGNGGNGHAKRNADAGA